MHNPPDLILQVSCTNATHPNGSLAHMINDGPFPQPPMNVLTVQVSTSGFLLFQGPRAKRPLLPLSPLEGCDLEEERPQPSRLLGCDNIAIE